MGRLDDKVAVITGAGRGIGREIALMMAGESVHRLIAPVPIAFDQAIVVAFLGRILFHIADQRRYRADFRRDRFN